MFFLYLFYFFYLFYFIFLLSIIRPLWNMYDPNQRILVAKIKLQCGNPDWDAIKNSVNGKLSELATMATRFCLTITPQV